MNQTVQHIDPSFLNKMRDMQKRKINRINSSHSQIRSVVINKNEAINQPKEEEINIENILGDIGEEEDSISSKKKSGKRSNGIKKNQNNDGDLKSNLFKDERKATLSKYSSKSSIKEGIDSSFSSESSDEKIDPSKYQKLMTKNNFSIVAKID